MGFKYINEISNSDNLNQFLELVDLAAGSSKDVNNAFDLRNED
jgi:hypothetical protein